MINIFDAGLLYQDNYKETIINYIKEYGFPCNYLTQNNDTQQMSDWNKYQLAFGQNAVGFSNNSESYKRTPGYLLIDKNNYTRLALGQDSQSMVFVPEVSKLSSGDKLEIEMKEGIFIYVIEDIEDFHGIMYKCNLKFVNRKLNKK
jgi:hypothetical protein